ncbi:MAG TPA: hypothetical protein VFI28_11340 [Candidatus Limnocylindrales bacterium]|nr:hypothetical protein [Candidatus Limnocylindrales bacterium]
MSRIERRCTLHRPALLDLAGGRSPGPDTAAALEHLERCPDCRRATEADARTAIALRRLTADARAAEPPPDAWSRLRDRLEASRAPAWRVRTTLGAIVVGAALAGTLVAPRAMWRPRPAIVNDSSPIVATMQDRAEQLMQRSRFGAPLPPDAEPILAPGEAGGTWGGPDGIGVAAVEVTDVVPGERVR